MHTVFSSAIWTRAAQFGAYFHLIFAASTVLNYEFSRSSLLHEIEALCVSDSQCPYEVLK